MTLLFKPQHVKLILEGKKTQTRRISKPRVKVGGIYEAKTRLFSKEYFALIKITGLREEKLGDISDEDVKKEGYNSLEEFIEVWKSIYGSWEPERVVWVLEFEVVNLAKSRMYENVKTWNPFVGCRFHCVYCKPSFQRQAKRRRKWCELCYKYEPHFHPERLQRVPSKKTIFCCAFGDVTFAKLEWIEQIFEAIKRHPNKTFYIQTKDPRTLRYINDIVGIPKNVKLGVTLETDLDNYETPSKYWHYSEISRAPTPSKRIKYIFSEARNLVDYITIEPILDFSPGFVRTLELIYPEFVYIGYDDHNCKLPEPPLKKTLKLIEELEKFTEVRFKKIRDAWWEANPAVQKRERL